MSKFHVGQRVIVSGQYKATVRQVGFTVVLDFDSDVPAPVSFGNVFRADGTGLYSAAGRRMVPDESAVIDVTRPLQLADGRSVEYVPQGERYAYIDVRVGGRIRSFHKDGRHASGSLPRLQNVPNSGPAIVRGTKLYNQGREATVLQVAHGVAMFTRLGSNFMVNTETGEDQYGNTWTTQKPAPKPVRRWQNVYADGTVGTTKHKSYDTCAERTKYGKVRVAILRTDTVDGGIVDALVTPTTPKLRTSGNPSGSNPFAETGSVL